MRKISLRNDLSWHLFASRILIWGSLLLHPGFGFPMNLLRSSRLLSSINDGCTHGGTTKGSQGANCWGRQRTCGEENPTSSRRGIVALSNRLPSSDPRRRTSRRKALASVEMKQNNSMRYGMGEQSSKQRQLDRLIDDNFLNTNQSRRTMLLSSILGVTVGATAINPESADAAGFANFRGRGKSSLYVVDTRDEITDQVRTEQVLTPVQSLSSEYALLEVLPVTNKIFRTLEAKIESLSDLISINETTKNATWVAAQKASENALETLIQKQGRMEPAYNPEDSTELAIEKATRCEVLIDELRSELEEIVVATYELNATRVFYKQKDSLLALSYLGELLVKEFPYIVPSKGKFSFLPRLQGRAKVTFRMKRGKNILGNVTIIADGYAAPITAGNFVDLCIRNFYTGLPIKAMPKKFGPQAGPQSAQQLASVNVMGSYNEGFYDPLTAKLRQIPLEIIRLEVGTRRPKLSYSAQGLSGTSISDKSGDGKLLPSVQGRPLLTFDTPGLVAMNHPDKDPNGASSEFFCLQAKALPANKRKLLDSEYAPFGFIVGGYDIYETLEPGDVIDATFVDPFGKLNLMKIRQSSFQDAAQGPEVEQ